MGTGTTRIGGLFGVASAVAVIPAYVVGSPEVPKKAEDARRYYEDASSFLSAKGTLPLLHVLFGLLFLGCSSRCCALRPGRPARCTSSYWVAGSSLR